METHAEREPLFSGYAGQQLDGIPSTRGIDARYRFVGDQRRRLLEQSPRQGHSLLLTSGKSIGALEEFFGDPDPVENLEHFAQNLTGRKQQQGQGVRKAHLAEAARDHVLGDSQIGDEVETLMNETDATAHLLEFAAGEIDQPLVSDVGPAFARALTSVEQSKQRRLARTTGSDEAHGLTGSYFQVDAVEGASGSVLHRYAFEQEFRADRHRVSGLTYEIELQRQLVNGIEVGVAGANQGTAGKGRK